MSSEGEPLGRDEWAPMSDASTKPRRRWFQFSLRTLLLLVTLVAGLLVGWRMYTEPYRRQHETMALIKNLGGNYETAAAEKRLRLWYGATQNVVRVDVADCSLASRRLLASV